MYIHFVGFVMSWFIWASLGKNLSSGFRTKLDSNQSPQLQKLARKLKGRIYSKLRFGTFQNRKNKGADQTAQMYPSQQLFSYVGTGFPVLNQC